jgi:hypothetical protein
VCSNGCDHTSIQAAVDGAADRDTIELGPEHFLENVRVIGKSLTIRGAGPSETTVDGDRRGSVFRTGFEFVKLAGMTIQNGYADLGGGIFAYDGVVVEECWITQNEARLGAGMYVTNQATVLRSTISDNTASSGGGIYHFESGELFVSRSTISGNRGGGILHSNPRGPFFAEVMVLGSTISGNDGAGFEAEFSSPTSSRITITDGTIVENTVGIHSSARTRIARTLLANRVVDCVAPVISEGYNLASDGSCGLDSPTDLPNTNPNLRSLSDHGGPSPTHAPTPGSPALDAAGERCPATDQRGVARPQRGRGHREARCDIGAFELAPLEVEIDTTTFGRPSSVNIVSRKLLPVAVLGTDTFDVHSIDLTTLRLGPGGAAVARHNPGRSPRGSPFRDVDGDGHVDLLVHFNTASAGFRCSDTSVRLTGVTIDGRAIDGAGPIATVGRRSSKCPPRPGPGDCPCFVPNRTGDDRLSRMRGISQASELQDRGPRTGWKRGLQRRVDILFLGSRLVLLPNLAHVWRFFQVRPERGTSFHVPGSHS